MLEEPDHVPDACVRAAQETLPRGEVARVDQPRRLLDLVPRMLEPELGRLVHGLEQQLVAVHPVVCGLLEREQRVGPEVALVVASARAGQDRCELVRHQILRSRPASGTPPPSVTSHVSCMYRHSRPSAAIACGCMENTMFAASSVSTPSPIFGNSIIVIPIEWPVTWPRWYPRPVKPAETARWTSCAVAPGRNASFAVS